jgi:hypothetical protein
MVAAAGTPAMPLQPGEPVAGAAQLRDIRGSQPMDGPPPFFVSGGLLLLLTALILARRGARRRAPVPAPAAAASQADAHSQLLAIAVDRQRGACTDEQLFMRLDRLIRDHLASTLGIPARRCTSTQLRAVAAAALNEDERSLLGRFLTVCDRVKFAAYRPDAAEVDWALNVAAIGLLGSSPAQAQP